MLSQLAGLFGGRTCSKSKKRPVVNPLRLMLQALEDRSCPATITVNVTTDLVVNDANVSLREALQSIRQGSNINAGMAPNVTGTYGTNDQIIFTGLAANSTITLGADSVGTQYGATGFFMNTARTVTIDGTTVQGLTISGGNALRLFVLGSTANMTFRNLTLSGGLARGGNGGNGVVEAGGGGLGAGGAIFNDGGTLTLHGVTLVGNEARGGNGGLVIGTNSTINAAGGGGGGMAGNGVNAGSTSGGNGGGSFGFTGAGGISGFGGFNGGFGGGGGGGGIAVTTGVGNLSGGNGGFGGGAGAQGAQGNVNTESGVAGFGGGAANGDGGFGGGVGSQATTGVLESAGAGAGFGGAIFNNAGTVTILNSTFTQNTARGGSKAVGATTTRTDAAGAGHGGAIFSRNGTLTINSSTISNNTVASDDTLFLAGRGVYVVADGATARVTINNTILGQANAGATDYGQGQVGSGTVVKSGSRNLIRVNSTDTDAMPGNFSGADPRLGAFGFNGGPTRTFSLLAGSLAVNRGNGAVLPAGTATDQRGLGFRRIFARLDIGAFESAFPLAPPVVVGPSLVSFILGQNNAVRFVATNNPTSFTLVGSLPAGLIFNRATGVLTGVPRVSGTFSFTIFATNEDGVSVGRPVRLSVAVNNRRWF